MESLNAAQGLSHLWGNADGVIRTVAIVLLLMSVFTWSIAITKAWGLRRHQAFAHRVNGFWHTNDITSGLEHLGVDKTNPFYRVALEGHESTLHVNKTNANESAQLHESMDLSDWVERALKKGLDDHTARAQRGLAVIASVASTAPFVGLFGTVWGIYRALMSIGGAGQVSMAEVAGPIGEALIMTALGLLVAIPAVLAYNALLRANKSISFKLHRFAYDLHAYFVTGARVRRARQTNVQL